MIDIHGLSWFPHPGPQEEFCSRGEYEILFGGAAGPGKTDCLIMEAARFVDVPGYRAVIFRRTFPQLQEIIDRCWKWYPRIGGEYKSGEHRWYFGPESSITLSHMQYPDNRFDHQGKEYAFAGFDEVTQFVEIQYTYILSRVRMPPPGVQLRVRSTTNPGGVGHVWVKERFVDVAPPLTTYIDPLSGQSRCFIPAKISDNPSIMRDDPLYLRRLEALPETEKKRLLHGDWEIFEGQAFGELSQRVHGCEPFHIPPEWERFMAFDWGYAMPYVALWFAIDFDGTVYLYRELYGGKAPDGGGAWIGLRQNNDQICEAILDVERERVKYRVADPACWAPTKLKGSNKAHGPSFAEDAARHGLFFLKADNDRIRGRQQCHQRFAMEVETDVEGVVVKEHPRFVAFNDCKHWWRTMTQMRESVKNPEDLDTDQEDHCLHGDTLVMTWDGMRPIRQLVGTSGFVLGYGGLFVPYSNCRMTRENAETVSVVFEDGRSVVCTPDHRFYVKNKGWVEAKDLTDEICYVSIPETINHGGPVCAYQRSVKRSRCSLGFGSTSAGPISSTKEGGSTERFGSILTGIFRRALLYTTRTTTRATTRLKTLCSSKAGITRSIMRPFPIIRHGWIPCTEGPQNGTGAMLVENGTGQITNALRKSSTPRYTLSAFFATLWSMACRTKNIAPTNASLLTGVPSGWTMSRRSASSAAQCSRRASSSLRVRAQGPVERCSAETSGARVVRVEPAGRYDVYCLEAGGGHAFAVEGGIVVHNCYDTTRYALMSRPIIPKRKDQPIPGTFRAERDRLIKAKKYARRHGVSLAAAYARVR